MNHRHVEAVAGARPAAWNNGSAEAVAAFCAEDGKIAINRGAPWRNRPGVAEMAAGLFAGVPDVHLTCDGLRIAGDHVAHLWTFTGPHAATRKALCVAGREEWDFDAAGKVAASRGWCDAADHARQAGA